MHKRYGIKYAERGMYDLLIHMDFSCKKSWPWHQMLHPRLKKTCLKKDHDAAKYYHKKRYRIMTDDEPSYILAGT